MAPDNCFFGIYKWDVHLWEGCHQVQCMHHNANNLPLWTWWQQHQNHSPPLTSRAKGRSRHTLSLIYIFGCPDLRLLTISPPENLLVPIMNRIIKAIATSDFLGNHSTPQLFWLLASYNTKTALFSLLLMLLIELGTFIAMDIETTKNLLRPTGRLVRSYWNQIWCTPYL